MAKGNTDEAAYVSFHFLEKGHTNDKGDFVGSKFLQTEFDELVKKVKNQKALDLNNSKEFDSLKFGRVVPFYNVDKVNQRMVFGTYKSAYWGHSYENTDKGEIPASSLNLREFCFILYLSDDGRIFIGNQYLGLFGDYTSLKKTLQDLLGLGQNVRVKSIHSDMEDFKNTIPTEVNVTLNANAKDIAQGNVLGTSSLLVFKKQRNDEVFEESVRDKLLSMVGAPAASIRKTVAGLLNQNETYSVDVDDIQNCTVKVRKKKGKGIRTIYLFSNGVRATRFHIKVKIKDADGLPELASARKKMIDKLNQEVIAKV